ncbi:MAG: type I phosphomannose isomerase catalytic subunit [Caulobacteraceae bacterium]
MREIIFFQRIYKEKIWGGNRLRTLYEMDIPSDHTGECWLVSAHPEGRTRIRSGTFQGLTLDELWGRDRSIFGDIDGDEFPLLIKMIDASDDLSIQVHPDDAYALVKGNGTKGKTECWYVLDCAAGGEVILGHNARTSEELACMVRDGKWEQLLKRVPVKKGDFIYVGSGTIHALKQGMMVLEIQQPSDTTFRLYDYGRLENGKPRKLHIEESLEVVKVPYNPESREFLIEKSENFVRTVLAETSFFSVYRYEIKGKITLLQDKPFLIIGVVEGQGFIDGTSLKTGDHLMLPFGYGAYELEGKMTLIVSTKEGLVHQAEDLIEKGIAS